MHLPRQRKQKEQKQNANKQYPLEKQYGVLRNESGSSSLNKNYNLTSGR